MDKFLRCISIIILMTVAISLTLVHAKNKKTKCHLSIIKVNEYDMTNTELESNFITDIEAFNNSLWIGTTGGLCILDKNGLRGLNDQLFKAVKNNEGKGEVHDIVKYLGKRARKSLLSIHDIEIDDEGNVYVSCNSGLFVFNGESWKKLNIPAEVSLGFISSIHKYKKGKLVMGTSRGGVVLLKSDKYKVIYEEPKKKQSLSNSNYVKPYSICTNESDKIWFSASDKALAVYHDNKWKPINVPENIQMGCGLSLYFRKTDNKLFIGLGKRNINAEITSGIIANKDKSFEVYSPKLTLVSSQQRSDKRSDKMSCRSSKASNILDMISKGLKRVGMHRIRSLYIDSLNNIWVGTNKGLAIVVGKNYETFDVKNNKINGLVTSITEDSKGGIWVATSKGLYQINLCEDSGTSRKRRNKPVREGEE